jgi:dTDP-4-amino-4,6-dideoxygalactose transaminase
MAAIALVQLKYLDRDNAYRRQLAAWYEQNLSEIVGVSIVPTAPGCESSRHLFQIRVQKRDELMLALNASQIFPGVHYRDNTEYQMYAYAAGSCPESHRASQEIVSLPMHLGVTCRDVAEVCDVIKHCLR